MALGSLGTTSSTALSAVTFNPRGPTTTTRTLSEADLQAIENSIVDDSLFAATNPTGILCTATTAGTNTITAVTRVSGGQIASIQVGALVLSDRGDILPGTFVASRVSGTSFTLSQNAVSTAAGVRIAFINGSQIGTSTHLGYDGILSLPGGRGNVIIRPGDVIAIDSTGWPIVVSAASIAYSGTLWAKA